MHDVRFTEITTKKIETQINDKVQVNVKAVMKMTFDWEFQQTTYPYMSDSGSGIMNLNNSTFSSLLNSTVDINKCMYIVFGETKFTFDLADFELFGGSSYIFKALQEQIEHYATDYLSYQLGDAIIFQITHFTNAVLASDDYYVKYPTQPTQTIIKDERVLFAWVIENNKLILWKSGYIYNLNII